MKIKIVTTEKKLTKSLINQMPIATLEVMQRGIVLGYVKNARKDSYNTALIEYQNEYYCMQLNWVKGQESVYRKVGRWSQSRKFDSPEDLIFWWEAYSFVKDKAFDTHIYI